MDSRLPPDLARLVGRDSHCGSVRDDQRLTGGSRAHVYDEYGGLFKTTLASGSVAVLADEESVRALRQREGPSNS